VVRSASSTEWLIGNLGEFGEFRSNGPIQVAGWLRASDRVTLHSGLDGTGDLTFETHLDPFSGSVSLVDVWAGTIALRAGSNTGLAGARVDALTNTPSFHGAAGGATRPDSFAFEQDRPVVDADRPATSQFGASTSGMAYRLESYDSSVTINDEDGLGGTVLALASETGSTGTPALMASLNAPSLKGRSEPSLERVPSGKNTTDVPAAMRSAATCMEAWALSRLPRST
jgi:hypothetical protein